MVDDWTKGVVVVGGSASDSVRLPTSHPRPLQDRPGNLRPILSRQRAGGGQIPRNDRALAQEDVRGAVQLADDRVDADIRFRATQAGDVTRRLRAVHDPSAIVDPQLVERGQWNAQRIRVGRQGPGQRPDPGHQVTARRGDGLRGLARI